MCTCSGPVCCSASPCSTGQQYLHEQNGNDAGFNESSSYRKDINEQSSGTPQSDAYRDEKMMMNKNASMQGMKKMPMKNKMNSNSTMSGMKGMKMDKDTMDMWMKKCMK